MIFPIGGSGGGEETHEPRQLPPLGLAVGFCPDISFDDFRTCGVVRWVPVGSTSALVPSSCKGRRKFRARAMHTSEGLGGAGGRRSQLVAVVRGAGSGEAEGGLRTGSARRIFQGVKQGELVLMFQQKVQRSYNHE